MFWDAVTGAGTLGLAVAAFVQMIMLASQRASERRFDIVAKDVRMSADGQVDILGISNLSRQYIVLRYVSLHDGRGRRIAHLFNPLVSIAPGEVLRLPVKLRTSDGVWDIFDGVAPLEARDDELLELAASIRLLFQIGGDPQRFHHVLMPGYATSVQGQRMFSHANMRVCHSSRSWPRGLDERCFEALDHSDPRPPEREER